MTVFFLSLFLTALFPATPPPQAEEAKIRVTAHVLKSRYCIADPDLARLDLLLAYEVLNGTPKHVLMRNGPYPAAALLLSTSLQDVKLGRQIRIEMEDFGMSLDVSQPEPKQKEKGVNIRPGAIYKTKGDAFLFVPRGASNVQGAILPGDYYLQVTIYTAPSLQQMRERPRKLQTVRSLTSEPFKIHVAAHPSLEESCTEPLD